MERIFLMFLDHTRRRTSGRVISSSQKPLPDKTQHSQQKNIHATGGIRTHNLSRRAAADLHLKPRGQWKRLSCRWLRKFVLYMVEIWRRFGKLAAIAKWRSKTGMFWVWNVFILRTNVQTCYRQCFEHKVRLELSIALHLSLAKRQLREN